MSSLELYDFQKISVNFLIDKRSSLLGDDMRPGFRQNSTGSRPR